jgi:16S rRNA (cytosine967-C5)-methyltransferase
VIEALLRQVERFPDLDPAPLRDQGLPARDAAFAHAVYDAAIRRWITLSHILSIKLRQPFPEQRPGVQAVLLASAAQLLLLDKVPPHAAINEAVNWSKLRLSGSLAGMVNGVLRSLVRMVLTDRAQGDELAQPVRRAKWTLARGEMPLSDGRAMVFRQDVLPEDEWEKLAIVTSCPGALLAHWRTQFAGAARPADEIASEQAMHLLVEPPTVLNVAFAGKATKAALAGGSPPLSSAHENEHARVWHGPRADLGPFLAAHRDVWVQDVGSAHVVGSMKPLKAAGIDGVIVDMCAGQGTKTRHLAAMFDKHQIIATDVDEVRLASLRELESSNVKVITPEELAEAGANAGLVLADVPCSNSGVLARRPEAKYRWSEEQTSRLVGVQRDILGKAAALVAPGGLVVYSTCSMDRAENQEQAAWAVASLGLVLEREEVMLPAGLPGESAAKFNDGSYAAWLRKPANAKAGGTKAGDAGTLKARRAKTASKKSPGSRA